MLNSPARAAAPGRTAASSPLQQVADSGGGKELDSGAATSPEFRLEVGLPVWRYELDGVAHREAAC